MMQGDEYSLGFRIRNNAGSPVTPRDVWDVEIAVGNVIKSYRKAEIPYADGRWMFPLRQQETFGFRPSSPKTQVRVVWANGVIEGKPVYGVRVHESTSKTVLKKQGGSEMAQDYGEVSTITVDLEGPFGSSGSSAKVGTITILAAGWKGAVSPYSQTVSTDIASINSIIELQPNQNQLDMLFSEGVALVAENDSGTVTIHALGNKPSKDMTIQITATEVIVV